MAPSALAEGGFELRGMDVFTEGDQVRFVTQIDGGIVNSWEGPDDSLARSTTACANSPSALPGWPTRVPAGRPRGEEGQGRRGPAVLVRDGNEVRSQWPA